MKKIFIVCGIIAASAIFFAKTGGMLSNPFEQKIVLAFRGYDHIELPNPKDGSPDDGNNHNNDPVCYSKNQGPCTRLEIIAYTPEPFYDCVYTAFRYDNCNRRQVIILNNLDDLSDKY